MQVDTTTRLDAVLSVGGDVTLVNVNDETPLLKTDRADVSTTLTSNELGKLPILDRNITSLLVALPGAGRGPQSASGTSSAENQQADQQTPVNGQMAYSNGFLLDGTENHSNILGLAVINPNPDVLEEFKVTSSNYDAQFGNVSGALLAGHHEIRHEPFARLGIRISAQRFLQRGRSVQRHQSAHPLESVRRIARRRHHQEQAVRILRLPGNAA